jgi:NTE family protein
MSITPPNAPAPAGQSSLAQPSISLALGGGGARGLAHILVLEVIDELGLKPKMIAGTSIGALMGAAYAMGLPGYRLRAIMEELLGNRIDLVRQLFAARSEPVQHLLRLLPVRSSLLSPDALLDRLIPEFEGKTFETLAIPLKVVATDLVHREAVVIDTGPLRPAIAASIAIPLVFSPITDNGRVLVDGGLVNPLPFDLIEGTADITIAIDVSGAASSTTLDDRPSAIELLMQSLHIMEKSITTQKLRSQKPDIYIDVELDGFGILEFWRADEIMAAAMPIKDKLRHQLKRLMSARRIEASLPGNGEPR